jgi:plasmid stability protein
MPTLVIKNLPAHIHARLKDQAHRNHRSLTKEAVSLLEAGVDADRRPGPLPPLVKLKGRHEPTLDEVESAIAEGQE